HRPMPPDDGLEIRPVAPGDERLQQLPVREAGAGRRAEDPAEVVERDSHPAALSVGYRVGPATFTIQWPVTPRGADLFPCATGSDKPDRRPRPGGTVRPGGKRLRRKWTARAAPQSGVLARGDRFPPNTDLMATRAWSISPHRTFTKLRNRRITC